MLDAKTASHNAKVEKVYEKSKEEDTDKLKALEERTSSKLSTADAKRIMTQEQVFCRGCLRQHC